MFEGYLDILQPAFDVFCLLWLPCTYQLGNFRCHNFKSTHDQKGHQGAEGNLFGKGPFQTNFDQTEFFERWIRGIAKEVDRLRQLLHEQPASPTHGCYGKRDIAAARLHQIRLSEFLSEKVGDSSDFVSHRVCLFCLRHNMPENDLPCGHTLCNRCFEMLSDRGSDWDTVRRLEFCPFHSKNQTSTEGGSFEVQVKPPHAGVRILCLDG